MDSRMLEIVKRVHQEVVGSAPEVGAAGQLIWRDRDGTILEKVGDPAEQIRQLLEASLGDVRLPRPDWIEFDEGKKTATVKNLPKVDSVPFPLEIDLVIEYYSKRL